MYYIERLYRFLDALTENNNREWFALHKGEYDELRALWMEDIDRMIELMGVWSPDLLSQSAKTAAYRIYRDTRFSLDKTPYKTFFSAAVSDRGRKVQRAGYYIEIGNARYYDQGLYAGLWSLDSAMLKKMRHAIVDNIEEWEEIVHAPELLRNFPEWCSDTIKTIPKGWDRNHPQAEYLRMTNYGRFRAMPREYYLDPSWPERSAELFSSMKPLIDFLNYSLDE